MVALTISNLFDSFLFRGQAIVILGLTTHPIKKKLHKSIFVCTVAVLLYTAYTCVFNRYHMK